MGTTGTRRTTGGGKGDKGDKGNKFRGKKPLRISFEGCWHCGQKGHSRSACTEFQKILAAANKGEPDRKKWKLPQGYSGKYEEAKKRSGDELEEESKRLKGAASGSGLSDEERKRSLESDMKRARQISTEVAKEGEQERHERRKRDGENEEEEERLRKLVRVEPRRGEKRKGEGGEEVRDLEDEEGDVEVGGMELNDEEVMGGWDVGGEDCIDLKTGTKIDPQLAAEARVEEVRYMEKIRLYEEVPVEECWTRTGRPPVSTKWVDVNKGTEEEPDIRCRLVARDFKPKGERDRCDLFAAMPPLEAKKLLFQKAVNENLRRRRSRGPGIKIMFIDVKKAHLYGILKEGEEAYIELPGEAGKEGRCGKLRRWLYGMRPAAGAWEDDYSLKLAKLGFRKGRAAPTTFYRARDQVRRVVHGDGFTFTGERTALEEIAEEMQKHYELKVRGVLGDEETDDKDIVILNRKLNGRRRGSSMRQTRGA